MMAKTTSVNLDEHLLKFVEVQVTSGRFTSESDVIRAALSLLEEQDQYIARLRGEIDEGDQSGPPAPFDFDDFIARKRQG